MARKRLAPATRPSPEPPAETGPAPLPGAARPFAPPPIAQVTGASASQAALDEMSGTLTAARAAARLIEAVPLDRIEADHLVRDRIAPGAEDEDMAALRASLRARGQQTPIDLVRLPPDATGPRYGLISGWRRLLALRDLTAEGEGPGTALARIRDPEGAPAAYVAMVEENEIRAALSHYERARIVVRAVEAGVFADRTAALRALFGHVSRAKRSKIRAFTEIVAALDTALRFPTALGERLGLKLAQALAEPDAAARLAAALTDASATSPAAEHRALTAALAGPAPPAPPPAIHEVGGVRLVHDAARARLTLDGVDPALVEALKAWLVRR